MTVIPPALARYRVPRTVLADTGVMLRERGRQHLEAVVLWVGTVADDTTADVLAAVMPGQVAYRGDDGCAVEVPPDALTELVAALPEGFFVLVRLHTHPGAAYHSDVDDTNMLISHNGAISIVVPDFAADPVDLHHCSVNELRHPTGWRELTPAEITERFHVR